jgi:hypothetical protein
MRPGQFVGRLYDAGRESVRSVRRKVSRRFHSIQCSTEDGISAFSVVELAVDFFPGAVPLPPIGACDVMVGKAAVFFEALTFSPVPAHLCVCCGVVSWHRHTRMSSSSRRWWRHAPLSHRSGRFTPTKDIVGCTRGRKTCSAKLHGRLVVRAGSKVESPKHTRIRSSFLC